MNSVNDETGAEAIVRKLLQEAVRELREQFMCGVAEVRGKCCARVDRRFDLFRIRTCVADADCDSGLRQSSDVPRRLRPMRRERDEPDIAGGCVLPACEFIKVGGTHPLGRMGSAWPVFGVDMRALEMKPCDRSAAGQGSFCAMEVAETCQHFAGRPSDYGGEAAGNAGGEDGVQSPADFFDRGARVVEIHAGEAVDLEVDEAGRSDQTRWSHWNSLCLIVIK